MIVDTYAPSIEGTEKLW